MCANAQCMEALGTCVRCDVYPQHASCTQPTLVFNAFFEGRRCLSDFLYDLLCNRAGDKTAHMSPTTCLGNLLLVIGVMRRVPRIAAEPAVIHFK